MHILTISTTAREQLLDITDQVSKLVSKYGWHEGIITLFCPHTTCGLTINEGADPDVAQDLSVFFSRLVPRNGWKHLEGNSDAHIKSSLLGCSLQLIVYNKQVQLGTWQSIYLYEGDGPRQRSIWAQWITCNKTDG